MLCYISREFFSVLNLVVVDAVVIIIVIIITIMIIILIIIIFIISMSFIIFTYILTFKTSNHHPSFGIRTPLNITLCPYHFALLTQDETLVLNQIGF